MLHPALAGGGAAAARNHNNATPLVRAARGGHARICATLIEHGGAEVNAAIRAVGRISA